jgi:hypothetical protein
MSLDQSLSVNMEYVRRIRIIYAKVNILILSKVYVFLDYFDVSTYILFFTGS